MGANAKLRRQASQRALERRALALGTRSSQRRGTTLSVPLTLDQFRDIQDLVVSSFLARSWLT